jgi:LysM domain
MRQVPGAILWSCVAFLLAALFSINGSAKSLSTLLDFGAVWGAKPVLAHFLLDPARASRIGSDLGLTPEQLGAIVDIAVQENEEIHRLEATSQAVIGDPSRTLEQKADWVRASGYNQKIQSILRTNQQRLLVVLGAENYPRLVDWIEIHWAQVRSQNNHPYGSLKALASLAQKTYPRSFEVYATRYDAGDRKIVALPDKCLKFANGGALQCDGYAYGQGYSVAISYEGTLVVALVGESGPWNVDDNYWSKTSDPQPRRKFADLPLGIPEAQAAYFDGYNGGLDQFGRLVTSPVAIDISKALAAELGLGPGNNKVTVSFMWTDGWDASTARQPSQEGQPTAVTQPPYIAWETAAPAADGSIVHIVKSGQTLVGIATVYGIPLPELLALNNLNMESVIQPGDQILIKQADPTPIPVTSTATNRISIATPTPRPSWTPSLIPSPVTSTTAHLQPDPTGITPASGPGFHFDGVLAGLLFAALVSLGLIGWGVVIRRKK